MKILIFGGTGFLGKYLVQELATIATKIYVVSRNINSDIFAQYSNVELIVGDITDLEIIIDNDMKNLIISECDVIIHAAALYELKATYENLYLHNVVGTKNVLHFIKKSPNLKAFYYVSTIAVADEQSLSLDENTLPERSIFQDYYSKTKYYAEKLVREFSATQMHFPVRIIRPGVIVGDSITGKIGNINGPYYFLELLKKFKHVLKTIAFLPLPFNPATHLHMIPVDHVAHLVFLLVKRDEYHQDLKTYHLICIDPPTVQDFLKDIGQELDLKTKFISVPANKLFDLILLPYLKIPKEIIPFMFSKISYDKTLTLKDLPELENSKYAEFKKIFF